MFHNNNLLLAVVHNRHNRYLARNARVITAYLIATTAVI